jgi:hypothetical protein
MRLLKSSRALEFAMSYPKTLGPLLLLLNACYHYVPLAQPDVATTTLVSAELSPQGAVEMAAAIGRDIRKVRGRVLDADGESITLAMISVSDGRGIDTEWKGEPVRFPRRFLADIAQRRFSLGRTLLISGAAFGGAVATSSILGGPGLTDIFGGGGGGPHPSQ